VSVGEVLDRVLLASNQQRSRCSNGEPQSLEGRVFIREGDSEVGSAVVAQRFIIDHR